MTTKITDANIEATGVGAGSYTAADITVNSSGQITGASNNSVVASGGGGPKISGIVVTDNSYTTLDDTSVSISGGYIKLTGTGFTAGCNVILGTQVATSVTFVSSTEVRAQVPAQSAGTYTVYLVNSDGGVGIRVNGLNYSATPTWTTTSPLPGGAKNVSISIQLAATSNSSVTYSLASGSTLPSGITLSSAGLLSGTVTDITLETIYNFTVVATDQENQDTPQAFQITITAGDQYYKLVSLHLSANGTNLATNNTFIDSSSNNFTITRAGNTTQGTFSPFSQTGWSNYFDGTGDYLQLSANSAFRLGTGDFTVEAWIYLTNDAAQDAATSRVAAISSCQTNVTTSGWYFAINGSSSTTGTGLQLNTYIDPTGSAATANYTFSKHVWYHVAAVRLSGTLTFYVNGNIISHTGTIFTDPNNVHPFLIGANGHPSYSWSFPGFISNYRFVKGVAVYTNTFIPPTANLTSVQSAGTNIAAITGTQTSLLICQSNRFVDTSTNNFSITRNGDTKVVAFSPFNTTASWSAQTNGGSAYYDGTGDYLSLPTSTNLNIAQNQPFTLEYWIYMIGDYAQPFSSWNGQGSSSQYNLSGGSHIYLPGLGGGWGATKLYWYHGQYGSFDAGKTCTVDIGKYQWVHIAWTRDSSNVWRLYINGVSQTVGTYVFGSSPWSDGQAMNYGSLGYGIGGLSNAIPGQCYISGLKFVVGTALYTGASFTLPTEPPQVSANTQVLTNFTNAGIYDATGKNVLETIGDAKISTTQSKWGGSSMLFDGTGDNILAPTSSLMEFGTGNFTVEFWFFKSANGSIGDSAGEFFVRIGDTASTVNSIVISTNNSQQVTGYIGYTGGAWATTIVSSTTFSLNTWHHVALVRSGTGSNQTILYVNGTSVGSGTSSTNLTAASYGTQTRIGSSASDRYFNGYIDDLRITRGYARYTSNFTAPTIAHPTF